MGPPWHVPYIPQGKNAPDYRYYIIIIIRFHPCWFYYYHYYKYLFRKCFLVISIYRLCLVRGAMIIWMCGRVPRAAKELSYSLVLIIGLGSLEP